jgi:dolichol-phosphate mannosyltransferase
MIDEIAEPTSAEWSLKESFVAELSVVIPTFNERDNVVPLVERLASALSGIHWEAIFVDDDSTDGTDDHVREIALRNPRIRCILRIGRRGLSSACIEGMLSSSAPYLAVMDADLQHDEALLPKMLQTLKNEDVDIVVGSRYVEGGGVGDWDKSRVLISRFAERLSRLVVKADLTDPMSGFFMLRREAFRSLVRRLSGLGFKVLLDIFASAPKPLRFRELPYTFRSRHAGESKLDTMVSLEYALLLLDKLIGHIMPVRFFLFASVGGLGLVVHLVILTVAYQSISLEFEISQAVATLVAMTHNFWLNNLITYRDMRLRGLAFVRGLLSFYVICSLGAVANVGVASFLFRLDTTWWFAGVVGALVGAVWNYAVSSVYTWRKSPKAH